MESATLVVENLKVQFPVGSAVIKVVNEVSFCVQPGQIMGLVGESGCGKSMTAYSILGLISPPGAIVGGSILFKGRELRDLSDDQLRAVRGNRIAMIFQDPMMTLNPVLRIDTQMIEAVLAHQDIGKKAARALAIHALARVGIPSPEEYLLGYPHQFSGGMRQRIVIAIALLNEPDLIICDEPTTALDVTIQGQILYEMQKLCKEVGTALIWITHDLSVVAGLADTLCVMYAGKIVESGTVHQLLEHPRHPYTHGLIASVPMHNSCERLLKSIPGTTPTLLDLPPGCAFRERCDRASAACRNTPPLQTIDGRALRCFHPVSDTTEMM